MRSEAISLELDPDRALVLFELLSRWLEAEDAVREIIHPAEDKVLSTILAALESHLVEPLDPAYGALLDASREKLAGRG